MPIEIYNSSQKTLWDTFVSKSRNGTFLFLRDYMEYHSDRFKDCSLLIWDEKNNLVALLPANIDNDVLISHGGLTFGGFIIDDSMKTPKMLQIFEETLTFLKKNKISSFIYKAIPYIYHKFPSEEDRYALFLCNARVIRSGALAVINNQHRLAFQERRNRGIKKAKQNGLAVIQSNDFGSYWQILSDRLLTTHNAHPVHTLKEIEQLHFRFPDNIKLFACFKSNEMLAGVVIYESDQVAHVQYIASNDFGRELSALDLIFDELVNHRYNTKTFFDFGTSDENNGRYLNKGLIDQKEGFGARAVVLDQYAIRLDEWETERKLGA